MAAYRRVYDSCHLRADCQEPGTVRSVIEYAWATFTFNPNTNSNPNLNSSNISRSPNNHKLKPQPGAYIRGEQMSADDGPVALIYKTFARARVHTHTHNARHLRRVAASCDDIAVNRCLMSKECLTFCRLIEFPPH